MWKIIFFALTVQTSWEYNMDLITHSSLHTNENDTSSEAPPTLQDEVLEFESHRNPTLQVMSARLNMRDVVDLCEALDRDDISLTESSEKKVYYYIPVTPKNGGLPNFIPPCYGWKRMPCLGIPKPPFDYRCSVWSPFFHPAEDFCGTERASNVRKPFDSMSITAFEAVSLCATAAFFHEDDIDNDGKLKLRVVGLPSNEASDLRCINYILAPEGGWIKETLDNPACDVVNKKRPSPYIDNEINSKESIIEEIFSDVIKCESSSNKVDCIFV